MRFQILKATSMKTAFLDVAARGMVEINNIS
jgi:hypothetical protein